MAKGSSGQVILRKKIDTLGEVGDVIRVKPGYARNFLIPRGWAVEATPGNIKMVEAQKRQQETQQARAIAAVKATATRLETIKLSAPVQVGEEDRVFGSVTAMTVAELLQDEGFNIDKKQVVLPEPIKALGVYEVLLKLDYDIEAAVKVYVIRE
ncbi:MAG: 50S ribosomal protein L9 [Fidelibacterota bacterium]